MADNFPDEGEHGMAWHGTAWMGMILEIEWASVRVSL